MSFNAKITVILKGSASIVSEHIPKLLVDNYVSLRVRIMRMRLHEISPDAYNKGLRAILGRVHFTQDLLNCT